MYKGVQYEPWIAATQYILGLCLADTSIYIQFVVSASISGIHNKHIHTFSNSCTINIDSAHFP